MTTFNLVADQLPGLFGWLAEQGETPSGPPFFRYLTIDMERFLDVEAGVPVAEQVPVEGAYFARTLPAGRYVTTSYVGHPDGLIDETERLLRVGRAGGPHVGRARDPGRRRLGLPPRGAADQPGGGARHEQVADRSGLQAGRRSAGCLTSTTPPVSAPTTRSTAAAIRSCSCTGPSRAATPGSSRPGLLSDRYRVLVPDRRRHGRTPDVEGPYTCAGSPRAPWSWWATTTSWTTTTPSGCSRRCRTLGWPSCLVPPTPFPTSSPARCWRLITEFLSGEAASWLIPIRKT